MTNIFLALFLIIFGLQSLFGLNLPFWIDGILALIAGILLLSDHFRLKVDRKP